MEEVLLIIASLACRWQAELHGGGARGGKRGAWIQRDVIPFGEHTCRFLDSIAITKLYHEVALHRNTLMSCGARAITIGVDFSFLGFDGVLIQRVLDTGIPCAGKNMVHSTAIGKILLASQCDLCCILLIVLCIEHAICFNLATPRH